MRSVFVLAGVPLHVPFQWKSSHVLYELWEIVCIQRKILPHLWESAAKEESTQNEKGPSSVGDAKVIDATSGRMSFAQFKALKEDRTKHFT